MKTPPRTRVVNFRITEQEYEEVKTICALTGRQCISEYARTAVLEFGRSQQFMRDVVERYVSNVDIKLARLLDVLEKGAPPVVPGKHDR